jgi:hypothetical protein
MPPPILLCLKSYGTSVAILDRLVNAGCQLDATAPMQVCSHVIESKGKRVVSSELEPVSVLMWALLQEEGLIDTAVVRALVQHGGKFVLLPTKEIH